jgi:hypothetical protein
MLKNKTTRTANTPITIHNTRNSGNGNKNPILNQTIQSDMCGENLPQ